MDVILMTTMLMSIGFSVDYTVHMAYHYARQVRVDCDQTQPPHQPLHFEVCHRPLTSGSSGALGEGSCRPSPLS